jgi:diadenylate cyclase
VTAQRASATALQIVRIEPRAPARHPGGPGAKREFFGNLRGESDLERTVAQSRSEPLYRALRLVAPGTPLRDGIDRILQAKMGALIVVGDEPAVLNICSGGFLLDAEFTPQRLSELAKMDGAIILASDGTRVARANVHLVPDPDIPTTETGTRHRTAERVARQIDVPVFTVSEEMGVVSVHYQGHKRTLVAIPRVLARADQALQILGRYKARLDAVTGALSALEVEDLVTLRDVVTVLQRAEMVRRIADEIEGYVVELGDDGRLVALQLEELTGGVEDDRRLVGRDYFVESAHRTLEVVISQLGELSDEDLLDLRVVGSLLGLPPEMDLDSSVQPRGYRLLNRIPRLPEAIADHVIERFGRLPKIMRASIGDLVSVEGVGEARARAIKDGLARVAETSILDRYS